VKYPRIVGQNKPKYRYCQSCQAKGRKTVATWVCIDCSNDQQKEVLVCEDCLYEKHEDHYAEEILY
jgi:predicted amidophosphoribosyltransferase